MATAAAKLRRDGREYGGEEEEEKKVLDDDEFSLTIRSNT